MPFSVDVRSIIHISNTAIFSAFHFHVQNCVESSLHLNNPSFRLKKQSFSLVTGSVVGLSVRTTCYIEEQGPFFYHATRRSPISNLTTIPATPACCLVDEDPCKRDITWPEHVMVFFAGNCASPPKLTAVSASFVYYCYCEGHSA